MHLLVVADTAVAVMAAAVMAVDTSVDMAAGISEGTVAATSVVAISEVDTSADIVVDTSLAATAAISGMAIGGVTALVRAGFGRMLTANTCGIATKEPAGNSDSILLAGMSYSGCPGL
jgi:hypothetical protein